MRNDLHARHIILDRTSAEPTKLACDGAQSLVEILVKEGVNATVFDVSTSALHAVRVRLEPRSSLSYVSVGTGSTRKLSSEIDADAVMHWHCTTIGPGSGHSLISRCIGANAVSNVDWIFAVQGHEVQSVDVRNVFAAKNGGGEITLKGVAEDRSLAAVNGMIEITEEGRGTDTYLTEDVLMLDPTAKVDAVPGLEIRTNDVKASHSATVSRVTAEDLFYLQSRGIDAVTARDMYTDGFLGDLLARIENDVAREAVRAQLYRSSPTAC